MKEKTPAPEPASLGIMLRLFLVPLLVIAACVGVFLLFGLISGDRRSGREYLNEIRAGTEIRRWQAAYELASWLSSRSPEELQRKDLTAGLVQLFRDSGEEDPRVKRYLALALGRLRDPQGVPALLGALEGDDSETVIFATWALGRIGAPEASPPLEGLLNHADPGIRKMAAHSLGTLGVITSGPPLREALNDPEVDVAWNAALALSRMGDPMSLDLLIKMTDRTYLNHFLENGSDRQEEIMINAVRGLGLLGIPAARPRLLTLSREDPSTRVRSAALEFLEPYPEPEPSPP